MVQEFFMLRKKKLFILITALLLIPILMGTIPLKMAHKLAQGGPFSQSTQGCNCNNCPAHSLISHNHFDAAVVNSMSLNEGLPYFQEILYAAPKFFYPQNNFSPIPLRC